MEGEKQFRSELSTAAESGRWLVVNFSTERDVGVRWEHWVISHLTSEALSKLLALPGPEFPHSHRNKVVIMPAPVLF